MSWPALKALSDLLRFDQSPSAVDIPWEDLIAAAGNHMVTPALMKPVSAIRTVPTEVRDYFVSFHSLNGSRNKALTEEIWTAARHLQQAGFEPVFLKGAAGLASQLYTDPGERIVGDIDILLPHSQLADASKCLRDVGYTEYVSETKRWIRPSAHHAPMLVSPGFGIGIELHQRLTRRTRDAVLTIGDGRVVTRGADHLRVPSPTDGLIHNILHDQIHHKRFRERTVELRQLRDLALLGSRHRDEIDWDRVERTFVRAGIRSVLHKQVALCRELLGVDLPIPVDDPQTFVRDLSASAAAEGNAPSGIMMLCRLYAEALRDDPLLAVNILDPRSWPSRLQGIRKLLQGRPRETRVR